MKGRVLALAGLACPLVVVALILLMRMGVVRFWDDFTGFKAVGFFLTCLVVLAPVGLVTSGLALWLDRRSWLARAAAAVNLLLTVGTLAMIADFAF